MIVSDNAQVADIISMTVKQVIEAGGYVNPDLCFICDQSHPYGALRLEGVANDVLSLSIPKGMDSWLEPHIALGRSLDKAFYASHAMEKDHIAPLIDMANHSLAGGGLVHKDDCYELYGSTFCYSRRPEKLTSRFGIDGGI